MTKIFSKNPTWCNRDIILPEVGKVHFDDNCEFEVADDTIAKQLVAIESLELEIVGVLSGSNKDEDKDEFDNEGELSNLEDKEEKPEKKEISKMNKSELIAEVIRLGKDGGEDLSDRKKKQLIEMIESPIEEEVEGEGVEEVSNDDKINFINSIEVMSELRELAQAFPEGEWKNIKSKAKLKDYLIEKIQ